MDKFASQRKGAAVANAARFKALVTRKCANPACRKDFQVKPYRPTEYCSRKCGNEARSIRIAAGRDAYVPTASGLAAQAILNKWESRA